MSNDYLNADDIIDWQTAEILALAKKLAQNKHSKQIIAQTCFEWVRDEIKHSFDYKLNPVTCKASDVLRYRTGYCFAKAHLLVALLRANELPAGLCYQRLSINNSGAPFSLHGLAAVYLEPLGWYRIDPRGNKPGVTADFCPPVEKLAFDIKHHGEIDIPGIWTSPLPSVADVLQNSRDIYEVWERLPDIKVFSSFGLSFDGSVLPLESRKAKNKPASLALR